MAWSSVTRCDRRRGLQWNSSQNQEGCAAAASSVCLLPASEVAAVQASGRPFLIYRRVTSWDSPAEDTPERQLVRSPPHLVYVVINIIIIIIIFSSPVCWALKSAETRGQYLSWETCATPAPSPVPCA